MLVNSKDDIAMDLRELFVRRLKEILGKSIISEKMKEVITNILSMIDRGVFSAEDFKEELLGYFSEIINSKYTDSEEKFICKELSLQLKVGAYDYDNGFTDYKNQCKYLRKKGMDEKSISDYILEHGINHETDDRLDKQ